MIPVVVAMFAGFFAFLGGVYAGKNSKPVEVKVVEVRQCQPR